MLTNVHTKASNLCETLLSLQINCTFQIHQLTDVVSKLNWTNIYGRATDIVIARRLEKWENHTV
jgi:hypothetical protein